MCIKRTITKINNKILKIKFKRFKKTITKIKLIELWVYINASIRIQI